MSNIFVFSDIHGNYNLYKAIMNYCNEQDPKATIIFLGDACDRGEDGYKIMCGLLNLTNVIYLKGNHEDMFVKACEEVIHYYSRDDELYEYLHNCHDEQKAKMILNAVHGEDIELSLFNKGFSTLRDWLMDGANEEFVKRIKNLPMVFTYNNIDFCHSAASPKSFNNVFSAKNENKKLHNFDVDALLWDRNCLNLGWTTGRIAIFGHTPTPLLHPRITQGMTVQDAHPCAWQSLIRSERNKRQGWKIDLDTGTFSTKKIYIMNIKTNEMTGFLEKNGEVSIVDKYILKL